MAGRRLKNPHHGGGDGESPNPMRCPTCGESVLSDIVGGQLYWVSRLGDPPLSPVHCLGSPRGYNRSIPAHHGRVAYRCWRCGQHVGCDQCAGPVTELLCRVCIVWVHPDAFAHHGPMLNLPTMIAKRGGRRAPGYVDYPPEFRAAYDRAEELVRSGRSLRESMARVKSVPDDAPGSAGTIFPRTT